MKKDLHNPLSYQSAGVDIDAGDRLVSKIKAFANKTNRPEVLAGIGGFGALVEVPLSRYKNPVLVSGTDGVGTKLKIAFALNQHETIGIDLVAMCVNDIVVSGAEPLFFLDYFATGKLSVETATEVIRGISHGCELAGTALVGGETAEMPGMYAPEEYDLAGFAVGVVEKDKIIRGEGVQPEDVLIGLASSGVHSNGYSLVRKILEVTQTSLSMLFEGRTLGEILLEPTRIYVKPLLALLKEIPIKAMAHITGGGLVENIPRVLPKTATAVLIKKNWEAPAIFEWLQQQGNLSPDEMARTFNCGIGMVLCVSRENSHLALQRLHQFGEKAWLIGKIVRRNGNEKQVVIP